MTIKLKNGLFEIHLAVLLFGFSGLFGKLLDCSPMVIVFSRTGFAALALLPFIFKIGSRPFQASKKQILLYLLQGGLLAAHWITFFHAIQISTVAIGLLTFSTFPLFVTILEPVFFHESLTIKDGILSLMVFAGLVLILPSFDFSQSPVQGALWGILSGLSFAILSLLNRKNVEKNHPLSVAFHQNLFACLSLAPFISESTNGLPGLNDIFLLLILGVFCTAMAHTLFIKALIHIKARTASIITGLEPVYGIVFPIFLWNEIPECHTLAGGALILAATTSAGYLQE